MDRLVPALHYLWADFYRMVYLEYKMHGYQFNHGDWCMKNFQQRQIDYKMKLYERYKSYHMLCNMQWLNLLGRDNESFGLNSYS